MSQLVSMMSVLDGGYVRVVTYTPWNMVDLHNAIDSGCGLTKEELRPYITDHDLAPVNAARASFAVEKTSLSVGDYKLLKFLADAKPVIHGSPFRHTHITLEVEAPLFVCRQWWRHVVGCGTTEEGTNWSELSRRYVRGDISVHIPSDYRAAAENVKQGSGAYLPDDISQIARKYFENSVNVAVAAYENMIALGVAPEQAREVLPQSAYTTFRWTPSIQGLAQFLVQRLDDHAQHEIRVYADVVAQLTTPIVPASLTALVPSLAPFDR